MALEGCAITLYLDKQEHDMLVKISHQKRNHIFVRQGEFVEM